MITFQEAKAQQAYAKLGILGFAGSGKTFTAHAIARGVHKLIKSSKPVVCIETESGVDFMLPLYTADGIPIQVAKTRAFADLMVKDGLIDQAEGMTDIIVIDSVTHFWADIVESYRRKNGLTRLAFQDWNILKPMWGAFTDRFLNSRMHFIICGRAGYEYDYFQNDDGKMELYKTGTKMKVEAEMGYEPSLLVEMERAKAVEIKKTLKGKGQAKPNIAIGAGWVHRAHIIKDRSQLLDGAAFDNPSFEDFLPHFKALNLGGDHLGVETSRDSQDLFTKDGKPQWKWEADQKEIIIAEFFAGLDKVYPSPTTPAQKKARIMMGESCFGVKSREAIDALPYLRIKEGAEKAKWYLNQASLVAALLTDDGAQALIEARENWLAMLAQPEGNEEAEQ